MVVTLAAYSLVTPQWIIPLRWQWIPPAEHVELEASDLLWHIISLVIQSDGLWGHIYSRFDRSDSSRKHLLRLMESFSDPSCGLWVVAACYTRAYFPFIISSYFQLSVLSHHVSFPFDVQSRVFILTFRVVFSILCSESYSQFRRSDLSFVLSLTFRAIMSLLHLTFRVTFLF